MSNFNQQASISMQRSFAKLNDTNNFCVHFLDGVIKAWDYSTGEAGKLVRTCHEHGGWITNFLYWYVTIQTGLVQLT